MSDTIAALATPSGESAISVIRLSGTECKKICSDCLDMPSPEPRRAYLKKYSTLSGEVADEVVAVFYKAPYSYTGEDCLEISCHGNPFIVQNILSDLLSRNIRSAYPGEFTRRAFLNSKMDLSQAEAVALVIGARSSRSLKAARRQLSGSVGKKISEESAKLVEILAEIEAYIDFPDEDLPRENAGKICSSCRELAKRLRRLLETSRYSALLHQGINAPIVGAPNAGKSSILNALLGNDRAIVSGEAGTTRDFIVEKVDIGGFSVNLTDTAGLRKAESEIEAIGVKKTLEKISNADLILLAFDSCEKIPELPENVWEKINPKNTIIIENKCELPNSNPKIFDEKFGDYSRIRVSCSTGEGFESFRKTFPEFLKKNGIVPETDDTLVGARHADALARAAQSLESAADMVEKEGDRVFAASDLRDALDALGEIVGKCDNESVLDSIFSKFCIGK